MDSAEERVFIHAIHALATGCNVPQFRCQIFDEKGAEGPLIASGVDACKLVHHFKGDGRCGPGGAAALLRSLAAFSSELNGPFASALRNAARLTFDSDDEFDKMFPLKE